MMRQYKNPICLPKQGESGTKTEWAGVGDPFVYRFNGKFYLYPSAGKEGIIAWESEDLIEWHCVGKVSDDPALSYAYAPEIFYFNGTFYLITSPKGEGHYLYTSGSPVGPFVRLTDNLGFTIDGSMFADDDGTLYFFRAGNPSIYAHKMERNGKIHEGIELYGTSMGHWTEGPGVLKRGGRYYMTMTGNHLLSRGYRIDYAVSEDGPMGPWKMPRNKTLLVNTDYETGSLGHSSSVIGPDLDSYWIFYHSYPVSRKGERNGRNSRMDRLLFPGDEMVVSGPSQGECPAPERADFYGWCDRKEDAVRFRFEGERILSEKEMGRNGTAEVTLVPGKEGEVLFAFRGEEEYIGISCMNGKFTVRMHRGEIQECLLDKALFEGFRMDVMHTLRIEAAPEETRFLVDMMLQGITGPVDARGAIGTVHAMNTSFCAFHGQVGQSGDRLHYNHIPGTVYALLSMPGTNGEVYTGIDGQKYLLLRAGETIRFRLNVEQEGEYHVQALIQAFGNASITWEFQGGTFQSEYGRMECMRRKEAGRIWLSRGIQECSATVERGELLWYSVDLFPALEPENGEYAGLELCHKADQIEGDISIDRKEGMQMDRRGQVLSRFGERFHADGFIEADLLFYELDHNCPAGLFLRVSEDSSYPAQIQVGHRGYFAGFDGNEMFIWRMDFGKKELWRQRCPIIPWKEYHIRMEIREGRITVWVDGVRIVSIVEADPLPYGRSGVGSFGARILVEKVRYELR